MTTGWATAFDHYDKYFSPNTNTEAVTYLQLANDAGAPGQSRRHHHRGGHLRAMPGLCLPVEDGGIGFDYRLAMGMPGPLDPAS